MKKLLIAFLLVLFTTSVFAETRLALGGWSKHIPRSNSVTNETHNIVGIEHNGFSFGRFDNSYDRTTYYLARNWREPITENWNWIASLGVSQGYRYCFGDDDSSPNICPHGYVGFEYDKYRVVPTFKLVPGALVFSPEVKF